MRRFALPLVGVLVAGVAAVVTATPAQATPTAGGTFVPVKQTRLVDTRSGVGVPKGALRAGGRLTPKITGAAPSTPNGVVAVAGTITVVSATANGGLALAPAGKPATTNLQFRKGQAVSNSSITRVYQNKIGIYDTQASGTVQVIFDVTGYYLDGNAPASAPGTFHAVDTPARVADTRTGLNTQHAKLAAGHTMVGSPGGHGGLANRGANAIAVTITAVNPTAAGSLVAFEPGTARPTPATLYFGKDLGGSAFAIVPVSQYSQFDVYSSSKGSVDVVVDAVGWFSDGAPQAEGAYQPLTPQRDGLGSLRPGQTLTHSLSAIAGLPTASGGAVLATLTIVSPTRNGGITVYSADDAKPGVTDIQFAAGEERVNQVLLPIGPRRDLNFLNASTGSVTVYLDVHGYTAPNAITPPTASVGRYLNDLTGNTSDASTMQAHGQNDGAHNTFALLDVGAQSITPPDLSTKQRGVAVALSKTNLHLTYDELVTDVESYIDGFVESAGANTPVTVAVGTNNDGAFDPGGSNYYAPTSRGNDWAVVIDKLRTYASDHDPDVDVVGADDIEAAFASTELQAQQWENAFLSYKNYGLNMIYNGDANSCPATFGTVGATCAYGWTQAQYYSLAHNGNRIQVLPQIFFPAEAVKWANIDATGASSSKDALVFAGALTEHPRDSSTLTGDDGWSALDRALSTRTASPSIPRSVELNNG